MSSGFRDKFQKRVTCVTFSIKFVKTKWKIAENSEICENYSLLIYYSLLFIIIHYYSFVSLKVAGMMEQADRKKEQIMTASAAMQTESQETLGKEMSKALNVLLKTNFSEIST